MFPFFLVFVLVILFPDRFVVGESCVRPHLFRCGCAFCVYCAFLSHVGVCICLWGKVQSPCEATQVVVWVCMLMCDVTISSTMIKLFAPRWLGFVIPGLRCVVYPVNPSERGLLPGKHISFPILRVPKSAWLPMASHESRILAVAFHVARGVYCCMIAGPPEGKK